MATTNPRAVCNGATSRYDMPALSPPAARGARSRSQGDAMMRGRKPRRVTIATADDAVLRLIAKGDGVPWYQVQRARIVLAIAAGERTQRVAKEMGCDEATVWRTCRRYEQAGLSG